MVQIISGGKGKGQTKILLDKVNSEVLSSNGTIVYLDRNTKHMYELNNRIRLINVSDYPITNYSEFLGFICGLISQDSDLDKIYLDSFLSLACVADNDESIVSIIDKLDMISAKFDVDFVVSLSIDSELVPEAIRDKVTAAL